MTGGFGVLPRSAGDGGGSPRTVYTLGPASGDYDIEWPDAATANPDAPPQAIATVDSVTLVGIIFVDDTIAAGLYGTWTIALPAELEPLATFDMLCFVWDASANAYVIANAAVLPAGVDDPGDPPQLLISILVDPTPQFAAGDIIYLGSITYLKA